MKWKIFAFVFALILLSAGGWYYRFIYSYEKWFDTHVLATVWTPSTEKEMAEIFAQPFRYCGKGSTSGAYVSDDGKIVLKTFVQKEFVSHWDKIPFFSYLANRRKELRVKYNRCIGPINAAHYIPKESGMVYYQFIHPKHRFHQRIQLIEKDGSISLFDPNENEFFVQKKAVLVWDYILDKLSIGEIDQVKNAITKLFRLTKSLYDQGIKVAALQFLDNFGFLDDELIRIDLEHIRFDPKWNGTSHYAKEIRKFREWFVDKVPELTAFFDETANTYYPNPAI